MKKIIFLGVLICVCIVTACQSQTDKNVKQADSNQTISASSVQEGSKLPVYNGSYYSVEGKYGAILLVNKKYPLDASYNPDENPIAQAAFLELLTAMQSQGFAVSNQYSGFRSYETQAALYQNYVSQDG